MLFSPTRFLFSSPKNCCAGGTGDAVSWGPLGAHCCGMSLRMGSGMLWGWQEPHSETLQKWARSCLCSCSI